MSYVPTFGDPADLELVDLRPYEPFKNGGEAMHRLGFLRYLASAQQTSIREHAELHDDHDDPAFLRERDRRIALRNWYQRDVEHLRYALGLDDPYWLSDDELEEVDWSGAWVDVDLTNRLYAPRTIVHTPPYGASLVPDLEHSR